MVFVLPWTAIADAPAILDYLDRAMAEHVGAYRDEWAEVLDDPVKLARFESFVNAAQRPDPDLAYVLERGQRRPATAAERASADRGEVDLVDTARTTVLVAGPRLEVRR